MCKHVKFTYNMKSVNTTDILLSSWVKLGTNINFIFVFQPLQQILDKKKTTYGIEFNHQTFYETLEKTKEMYVSVKYRYNLYLDSYRVCKTIQFPTYMHKFFYFI